MKSLLPVILGCLFLPSMMECKDKKIVSGKPPKYLKYGHSNSSISLLFCILETSPRKAFTVSYLLIFFTFPFYACSWFFNGISTEKSISNLYFFRRLPLVNSSNYPGLKNWNKMISHESRRKIFGLIRLLKRTTNLRNEKNPGWI